MLKITLLCTICLLAACHNAAYPPCHHRLQSGECFQEQTVAPPVNDLVLQSNLAVDTLLQGLIPTLSKSNPIWVSTIADVTDLDRSTPLGRKIAEQAMARLVQHQYTVMEARLNNDLSVTPHTGEFLLSRHQRTLGQRQNVGAALVGTYAVADQHVYVTLRLLSMTHGRVMAGYAYSIPIDADVHALLKNPSWWRRL